MGTLQHVQHQISALNDLVKVNNDRIVGYEKAMGETKDADLIHLFQLNILQSKKNVNGLKDYIHLLGGDPTDGTTLAGKLHHTWTDLKASITHSSRRSILADCEYDEEITKAAYRKALDDKELIWEDEKVIALLSEQLEGIKGAYESIKMLKDNIVTV